MIEHGGGKSAVEPAPPTPVLGQRLEQALGRPDSIRPLDDLDERMQRAEEPPGFGVVGSLDAGGR